MANIIPNAANKPLFQKSGTLPDVSGALKDYFQTIVFESVTKSVTAFQVMEVGAPIIFQGLIQPFTERRLMLLQEGQRAWTWYLMHADPVLTLEVDDVAIWNSKQTRVMSRKDYGLYGFVEYTLIQDWNGSGP